MFSPCREDGTLFLDDRSGSQAILEKDRPGHDDDTAVFKKILEASSQEKIMALTAYNIFYLIVPAVYLLRY